VPSGAIITHFLNGWVNTSSITSTGVAITVFRRLIATSDGLTRMTDARM
jgi:hypothetical protein